MPIQTISLIALLIISCSAFMVDQENYFYLNSSYNRKIVSLSACFRVTQPTSIIIQSDALVPQQGHKVIGLLDDQKTIRFDPPFDSEIVGYNNYDFGEYWFGIKFRYENHEKHQFVSLKLEMQQGQSIKTFSFLLPLFTFPLSGLLVYPQNSLKICEKEILVSAVKREGQFDVTLFGAKNSTRFRIRQEKDWGFFKTDESVNYVRFKSKSAQKITIAAEVNQQPQACEISSQQDSLQRPMSYLKEGYRLSNLLDEDVIYQKQQF